MSSYSITEPSPRQKWIAGILVIGYAILTILPLVWIIATGFKSPSDAIAYPPKVVFEPTLEGYVNLFTTPHPRHRRRRWPGCRRRPPGTTGSCASTAW